MRKRKGFELSHLNATVVFLLISAIIIIAVAMFMTRSQTTTQDDAVKNLSQSEAVNERAESIPSEVLEEAEQFCGDELAYVQNTFCADGYTESRLENIELVHTCDDVDDEIFEVYETTYLYRTSQESAWEPHPGYPSIYLVFQPDADGMRRWVCCFRDTSLSEGSYFEKTLHERLMDIAESYLYKLNAGTSLDTTLEQTMIAKMRRTLPGDGYFLSWKQLSLQSEEDAGTAYGLLLYYTSSGSPLISSKTDERYVSAIYSVCWLPVAISYQKNHIVRYTVTGYWMPSKENYEEDIRTVFPPDIAEDILKNIDVYATEILKSLDEHDYAWHLFSDGPVWPGYYFNEYLDNYTLLGLVEYYGEEDIYTAPIRRELVRRFSDNPDSILSVLFETQDKELRNYIIQVLNEMGADC